MDVFSLPEALRAPIKQLVEKCATKLFHTCRDVPSVVVDDEKMGSFVMLPYTAVLLWLKVDNLRVHSESCIAYLLAAWVKNNEGRVSDDEMTLLAFNIRVKHLSPSYLYCILPDSASGS